MKIIKIYSTWNQLKLKARAGHYNTEAHVRILGRGEGGHSSKTEKATQNIHWRKMCPRPLVWSEVRWTGGGQWPGYQCLHQECVSNIRATITITTLTASQQYNLASPDTKSHKHGQVRRGLRPLTPGPQWSGPGQTLCLCLFRDRRQMSGGAWHHEPECLMSRGWGHVTRVWPGGGAAGVTSRLSGIIVTCDDHVTWWHGGDKYADTKADNDTPRCFTQMNSICWSITQPQHAINFQSWRLVYSRKQYWHTQIHFQYLIWFLGLF